MFYKTIAISAALLLCACGATPQDWQNFGMGIQQSAQSLNNTMYNNTQMTNQMIQNQRSNCQSVGQGWAPTTGIYWNNVCP